MVRAIRPPSTESSTQAERTFPPAVPNRGWPNCATNAVVETISWSVTTERNAKLTRRYTAVTSLTPQVTARDKLQRGLRISPESLPASHQPPKVTKALIVAPAT